MVRVGATGGASKARMPEMNAQRLCRTQSQQSVHKEARTLCGARDYCLFARVVVMERVDAAIPPVVARIFSGDSTSPLTRGGKNVVRSEGGLAIPPVVARIFSGDSTSPLTREASVMV